MNRTERDAAELEAELAALRQRPAPSPALMARVLADAEFSARATVRGERDRPVMSVDADAGFSTERQFVPEGSIRDRIAREPVSGQAAGSRSSSAGEYGKRRAFSIAARFGSVLRGFSDALGGVRGMAGLATAVAVGVWIGAFPPAPVFALEEALLGTPVVIDMGDATVLALLDL